eukprot:TRINITY_DN1854_c0_g1_i3.p1 TRINITY_DN1854_c0_g1~~TRINITY_DN1854_c0_g1_i3.p1  ORF type:complete len:194 (-),score=17.31 TRINITY_DN1854_c0_g1_i3:180-761(-)
MHRKGKKRGAGRTCILDGCLSHQRKICSVPTNQTIKTCWLCKGAFLDDQRKNHTKQNARKSNSKQVYKDYVRRYSISGGYQRNPHNSPDKKFGERSRKHDHFWKRDLIEAGFGICKDELFCVYQEEDNDDRNNDSFDIQQQVKNRRQLQICLIDIADNVDQNKEVVDRDFQDWEFLSESLGSGDLSFVVVEGY